MVHKGMSLNWSFQGSRIKRNVVHRLLSGGLFWKCFHILSVEDQIADAIDMQMLPSWRSSTEKEMLVQVFRTQKKKKTKKKREKVSQRDGENASRRLCFVSVLCYLRKPATPYLVLSASNFWDLLIYWLLWLQPHQWNDECHFIVLYSVHYSSLLLSTTYYYLYIICLWLLYL